jgi:3-phosphoshikimate 1-carboxyvinyltransferase
MKRIMTPLQMMGAHINGVNDRAPLTIKPAKLNGIRYDMPVASAQVKSAVLLAGLFARGATAVVQPGPARDHTERMLSAMGADIATEGHTIVLKPNGALKPMNLIVPGDISSAAFPLVAALLVPGSDVTLTGVNLNPTRTGLLDVLRAMGADITVTETGLEAGEPVGAIRVRHSTLKGTQVGGDVVVEMIDEFPILMVAALHAEGKTVVRDAQELRVKETDRIAVMAQELGKLGARITETPDGFVINGPQRLTGAVVDGHDDHRVAMSLTVAGLVAEGQTTVLDAKCAGDSFPGFPETMAHLGADVVVQDEFET